MPASQRRNTVSLPLWKENTLKKKKREILFSLGEELEEEGEEEVQGEGFKTMRTQSFRYGMRLGRWKFGWLLHFARDNFQI
jgi:hypothetical protein